MSFFRNTTPVRRDITRKVSKYNDHKDDLKKDYLNRCGYCNSIDTWRFVWFEIDHFVPKKYLKKISETDYSNLVYSCRSCNNAKRANWPTKDENKHNHNNKGFIDPCEEEYGNQFDRKENGRIVPLSPLGDWMYNIMRLYKPQHEIIWKMEEVDNLIDEIEEVLDGNQNANQQLKDKLLECHQEFRKYAKQLSKVGLQ